MPCWPMALLCLCACSSAISTPIPKTAQGVRHPMLKPPSIEKEAAA